MSSAEYTADNITTLRGAAHIRQNPGMYVGNIDLEGLHHLVWELISNSLDVVLAQDNPHVGVTLFADGSCAVTDNGPGIPAHLLAEAMTVPGTSWKPAEQPYRTAFGYHGIGLKVVNALSEWCRVETHCDRRLYAMEFARGEATSSLERLGPSDGRTGTAVRFKPDPEIFGDLTFDIGIILYRLCVLAFLNSGVRFTYSDDRTGKTDTFHFADGLAAYVKYLNTRMPTLHEPITIRGAEGEVRVEVAFQFHEEWDTTEVGYVNSAVTCYGGTHLSGFRRGLMLAVKRFACEHHSFPADLKFKGEDFRAGLTAVVHVHHPEPQWYGATRGQVMNPELDGIVSRVVREGVGEHFRRYPEVGRRLCEHVVLRAEARIVAAAARRRMRAENHRS